MKYSSCAVTCLFLAIFSSGVMAEPNNIVYPNQWALNNTGQDICKDDPLNGPKIIVNEEDYSCDTVAGGEDDIDLNAPEAWSVLDESGIDEDVIIALIDTGIDINHPDLQNRLWINPGESDNGVCLDDTFDSDNNGFVDDCYGINTRVDWLVPIAEDPLPSCGSYVFDRDNWPTALPEGCKLNPAGGKPVEVPDFAHGTQMAGHMIAGLTEAGYAPGGVVGLVGNSEHIKLVTCAAADYQVSSTVFFLKLPLVERKNALECFDYLLDLKLNKGVNIVVANASGGTAETVNLGGVLVGGVFERYLLNTPDMEQGIAELGTADIMLAAAAGNEAANIDTPGREYFPAASSADNVLAVGAVNHHGVIAGFSSYSRTKIDVFAPGSRTSSSANNSSYGVTSGTSQATAYVSSLVAMIKSNADTANLGLDQIKRLIMSSGMRLEGLGDKSVSGKMVRAFEPEDPSSIERGGVLTCLDSMHQRRVAPLANRRTLLKDETLQIQVEKFNCANIATDDHLVVDVMDVDELLVDQIQLFDNGQDGDESAGDGIFSGSWTVPANDWFELDFGVDSATGKDDKVVVSSWNIQDNSDDGNSKSAWSWIKSSYGNGYQGDDYLYASTVDGRYFTWGINIDRAGEYAVFGRWPQRNNMIFASNAQYVVPDALLGGNTVVPAVVPADQSIDSGQWVLLGNFQLATGVNPITLRNTDESGAVIVDGYIAADAIKVVKVGTQ